MLRIASINEKGGVGKTTTTVNLSAALVERGRKVLAIDLDKQAHTTISFGLEPDNRSLLDTLIERQDLKPLVHSTDYGVDVVRSGELMTAFEKAIALSNVVKGEFLLQDAVNTLPPDRWDYVFYDCPPNLGQISINALTAADLFLIPVAPGALNLRGIATLLETVEKVQTHLNPSLHTAGVVIICKEADESANLSKGTKEILKKHFGDHLYQTVIRRNVSIAEAPGHHKPVLAYASQSSGAACFRQLAEELESRLQVEEGRRANA